MEINLCFSLITIRILPNCLMVYAYTGTDIQPPEILSINKSDLEKFISNKRIIGHDLSKQHINTLQKFLERLQKNDLK